MHDDTEHPMSQAEQDYYNTLQSEAEFLEYVRQGETREPIELIQLPPELTPELCEEYLHLSLKEMISRTAAGDRHVIMDLLPSLSDALVKRQQFEARKAVDNEKTEIAREALSAMKREKQSKICALVEKHGTEASHDVIAAAWDEIYPGIKAPSVSTISRARNAKK